MNANKFRFLVLELIDKYSEQYEKSLKEYLISFWGIAQSNKEKVLDEKTIYEIIEKSFITDSSDGNKWYNSDPFTYLECSSAWLEDYSDSRNTEEIKCGWYMLAQLLEMGRLYE